MICCWQLVKFVCAHLNVHSSFQSDTILQFFRSNREYLFFHRLAPASFFSNNSSSPHAKRTCAVWLGFHSKLVVKWVQICDNNCPKQPLRRNNRLWWSGEENLFVSHEVREGKISIYSSSTLFHEFYLAFKFCVSAHNLPPQILILREATRCFWNIWFVL